MRHSEDFLAETCRPEGVTTLYSDCWVAKTKHQNLPSRNTLLSKIILQKWVTDKDFPDKQKLREFNTID